MASNVERRTVEDARLQHRAEEDKPSRLVGYAAVFNVWTTLYQSPTLVVRERILPGAFRNAIAEGQDVRALINHDSSLPLGRTRAGTLRLVEDSVGLYFECDLPDTQVARDVAENVRLKNLSSCSFAFVPRSGGETVTTRTEDGVTYQDVEISDVDLYDVSVVTYAQYESTSVSLRAQQLADQARQNHWLETRRSRLRLLEIAARQ
jgi:HK97 family phage prohead protease